MRYDFIENETLRNYYEKEGVVLTDEQKAWFIAHSHLPFDRMISMLQEIETSDSISKFIQENLHLRDIVLTTDKESVYKLDMCYKDGSSVSTFASDPQSLLVFMGSTNKYDHFLLHRILLNTYRRDNAISPLVYNNSGELIGVEHDDITSEYNFYQKYIDIPYPFRRYDIVRFHNRTMLNCYGICLESYDPCDDKCDVCDDVTVLLDILDVSDGSIFTEPHLITEIEKFDIDSIDNSITKDIIESIISNMRGECSIGVVLLNLSILK